MAETIPPPLESDAGRDLPALWARLNAIANGEGEGRYDWLMGDAESVLRSLLRRCHAAEARAAELEAAVAELEGECARLARLAVPGSERDY